MLKQCNAPKLASPIERQRWFEDMGRIGAITPRTPKNEILDMMIDARITTPTNHFEDIEFSRLVNIANSFSGQINPKTCVTWEANASKTKCLRGHPLSGKNLRIRPGRGRECRQCGRDGRRAVRKARKALDAVAV